MAKTTKHTPSTRPPRDPDLDQRPVTVLAQRCPAGPGRPHHHQRHQLIYAISGVMRVVTQEGLWVVPSHRAVWVPAGTRHRVDASRPFDLCTLYVKTTYRPGLPPHCQVVAVPDLLRELLRAAAAFDNNLPVPADQKRLLDVLLDQINRLDVLGLQLLMPKDRRILRITQALQEDPSDNTTLVEWGQRVGASARTLERLFLAETHLNFVAWRTQVRLMEALEGLASGQSVIQVALATGYQDVSSFITMFKKALGTTPKAYFQT